MVLTCRAPPLQSPGSAGKLRPQTLTGEERGGARMLAFCRETEAAPRPRNGAGRGGAQTPVLCSQLP